MPASFDIVDSLTKMGVLPDRGSNGTLGNGTVGSESMHTDVVNMLLSSAGLHSSPLLQLVLFVHRQLSDHLGIDPSLVITLLGMLWSAQYLAAQAWNWVEILIERHLMCSISVGQGETIYDHMMEWLAAQPKLRMKRFLTAQTIWASAWEEEDGVEEDGVDSTGLFYTDAGQADMGERYLNFSNHAARMVSRQLS